MNDPIKILIVDDHGLVRKGMRVLLEGKPGFNVIGEAGDGFEAVDLARQLKPDVILLDLLMQKKDGITAIREIKEENKDAKILVLTSYTDEAHAFSAIQAGALGYLLKMSDDENRLVQAIQDVNRGILSIPANIAGKVMQNLNRSRNKRGTPPASDLTPRETDVLRLISKGLTNQEIGLELKIKPRTVTTHVSNIYSKIQVSNRVQAAAYAIQKGLISEANR